MKKIKWRVKWQENKTFKKIKKKKIFLKTNVDPVAIQKRRENRSLQRTPLQ